MKSPTEGFTHAQDNPSDFQKEKCADRHHLWVYKILLGSY